MTLSYTIRTVGPWAPFFLMSCDQTMKTHRSNICRKNNLAAKKSRDARRVRENQLRLRVLCLENANRVLREQVDRKHLETVQLRWVIRNALVSKNFLLSSHFFPEKDWASMRVWKMKIVAATKVTCPPKCDVIDHPDHVSWSWVMVCVRDRSLSKVTCDNTGDALNCESSQPRANRYLLAAPLVVKEPSKSDIYSNMRSHIHSAPSCPACQRIIRQNNSNVKNVL